MRTRRRFRVAVLGMAVMGLLLSGAGRAEASSVTALIAEENGNLDLLNVTAGTHTVIANNGLVFFGLAFNANESLLYGIVSTSFGSPGSLVTINQTTGLDTLVGANGVALTTITNLSNGELFGVGFDDNLYQINPNTGAATKVGPSGLPSLSGAWANSLASNGTTLYYTLNMSGISSTLYTLNTSTGAAVAIGGTGTSGIIGSVFAGPTFATGQLYGFLNSGQTDVIDLTTGHATVLNNPGITDIFGGVGIVTEATGVPEPTSLTLLATGALSLLGYGWRRRRQAA